MARSSVTQGEKWRAVPGFPKYIASTHGRVAHLVGHKSGGGYIHVSLPDRLPNGHGHSMGAARKGEKAFRVYAHHIIALTFIGMPPKDKPQVNHKDMNKSNNVPENLEWTSQKENLAHWRRMCPGVAPCDKPYKSSIEEWQRIRKMRAEGMSIREIASVSTLKAGGVRWVLKSPKYREVA